MFTIFHAIILGIVEGITEFLPISSTGHMILAAKLLSITETDFVKSFEIIIQVGAILAVLVLYWKKLLMNAAVFKRVLIAFIPTVIVGLTLYKVVKVYLIGNDLIVATALFVGGIVLIVFERLHAKKSVSGTRGIESMSYRDAVVIGLAQCVAIIPGVSRSAATIVGALALGYDRETAVEFTFLLAIPTMFAASGLDLIKGGHSFTGHEYTLLAVGLVTSFIVALAAVIWLLQFVRQHTFTGFGVYRILVAAVYLFIR